MHRPCARISGGPHETDNLVRGHGASVKFKKETINLLKQSFEAKSLNFILKFLIKPAVLNQMFQH